MSNRIEQNVIIVDSAMGNVFLFGTSSETVAATKVSGLKKYKVDTVVIDVVTTSDASVVFTGVNTGNVVMTLNRLNPIITFSAPITFSHLKCLAITGTAYIYLA